MSPRQQITPEMIDGWLATFSSSHTRSAYRSDLAVFTAWCDGARRSPLQADDDLLARYRRHHEDAGASPASIARRMSALNGFFRFAVHTGARAEHPLADTAPTVVPPSTTVALSPAQRDSLLHSLPRQTPATQLLVSLLLLDGLKLDEALGLDRAHVSGRPPELTATVRSRGHERTVALHPHTTTIIRRHLARRAAGPVFTSAARNASAGARLSRFGADAWLKKAGRDAGLEAPLTSNVLRRTHVQHAHRSGASVGDIQRHLGHDDARTTRRYLDPSPTHTPTNRR
jgi:site-specific recombinase XerD